MTAHEEARARYLWERGPAARRRRAQERAAVAPYADLSDTDRLLWAIFGTPAPTTHRPEQSPDE